MVADPFGSVGHTSEIAGVGNSNRKVIKQCNRPLRIFAVTLLYIWPYNGLNAHHGQYDARIKPGDRMDPSA
jgi:hypothetical protein